MEHQKVSMSKRQFRIGDLAKELKVKKFVVRFWEKEFNLKSDRSHGGQRFYTTEDLETFLLIKDLLYSQGFTIAGAKKQLTAILQGEVLPAQKTSEASHHIQTAQPATDHDEEQDDIKTEDDRDREEDEDVAQQPTQVTQPPQNQNPIVVPPLTSQAPIIEQPELAAQEIPFMPASTQTEEETSVVQASSITLQEEPEYISQHMASIEQAKEQLDELLAQEREKIRLEYVAKLQPIKHKLVFLKGLLETR